MLDHIKKYHIVLASNSPRRKELLSGLDIQFEQKFLPGIEELYPPDLSYEKIPVYLAQLKAYAYKSHMQENTLLITADTIVLLNGKVYGKPTDKNDAIEMLKTLSGHTHEVITGVCMTTWKTQQTFHAVSRVKFAALDEDEINYYVNQYKPCDKAGSYGIQEWIGYMGIESIEGSFYNVMGLPVSMIYQRLKEWRD